MVWDSRGLSIRKGSAIKTTGLGDAVLSPKLFDEDQIHRNYTLLLAGVIQRQATRPVGAKRVGNSVYLLAEWQDIAGEPWMEAVFQVDLAEPTPTFGLIEGLPGKSMNVTEDWDRLLLTQRGIVAFVNGPEGWGRAVLDSAQKKFLYEPLGKSVVEVRKRTDRLAHFISKTEYGSTVMGQVPIAVGEAIPLIETKGNVRLLDSELPWLFIEADQRGRDLHNSDTGAERMIPSDTVVVRTPKGILVWAPATNPTFAELLDINRLEVIARWTPEMEIRLRDQESKTSKNPPSKKKPPKRKKK